MLILNGHKKKINEIAFSADGMKLASAGRDGTARLWDLSGKINGVELKHGSPVNSVAFSDKACVIAIGGWANAISLWDYETNANEQLTLPNIRVNEPFWWAVAKENNCCVEALAFSPAAKSIVVIGSRGLACWQIHGDRWRLIWQKPVWGCCLTVSPDGKSIAAGTTYVSGDARRMRSVTFWELETGDELGNIALSGSYVTYRTTSLAYSPDGQMLAGACGLELAVWNTSTRELQFSCKNQNKFFQSVAFAPNGLSLSSASEDGIVRFWDTNTWEAKASFDWEVGKLLDVTYAPDGMKAAACSDTGKIIIWDVF